MLRQANYMKQKDEFLQNKLFIIENEKKKTSIANEPTNSFSLEPKCVNRNNCITCLEDPSCVWCSTNESCLIGDENGPLNGSCFRGFKYSYCNDSCFKHTSCSSCIEDTGCGWCGVFNKCIEGTARGSVGIICSNGYVNKAAQGRCSSHFLHNTYNK